MKLVETVGASDDRVVIPYKKYVMPNGMTVVLHGDASDPIVHVDVTYHVGSGREEAGRSGFAHFFEHMMFQGSENVADEEHFKIITEAGGTLNGTTNSDRTNYFETVPSNQLEKMLWLEADRMGFLLDAVTQEKFEVQRETVKNERGQRVDNRPYGLLGERVGEAMYPEGHPYSWSTIGYLEDLDRADLDDLKRFFLRWYGPNNAVLTVGGRFDEAQTLAWIAKYFGSIPAGPAVEPPVPVPVVLDKDRYISLEDNVRIPLIQMNWPTVYVRHDDEPALDVLMSIVGSGKTSLLYKNLVKDGQAVQAYAGHGCRELSCSFSMVALRNPTGTETLADLERLMRASLEEFETRGVQEDDLTRVKAGIVADMIFGLESVSGKVSKLAYYQTFTGTPDYVATDIARYEAVTAEDVMRAYETYIKGKPAVVMSIVPKGQGDAIAHADTWQRYERTIPERADEGELALRRPEDDFDRSVQPPAGENPTLTVPPIWRASLANGIPVLGAESTETPTTTVRLRVEVGQRNESLAQLGLASLTAEMLNEATERSTPEDISNRLEKLGSSITVAGGDRYTEITIRSLTEKLDETLAIAAEKVLEPKFDAADFARVKEQTLQDIEQSQTNAGVTASQVYSVLLFGEDNAFAHPDIGRASTVAKLEVSDAKAFYDAGYTAKAASIVAVSDLPKDALAEKLAVFGSWGGDAVAAPTLKAFPDLAAGTLYLIDKPDAAQSEIRIGRRAMKWDATGPYHRATLANFPLGGAFNSRVNLNLREDKGYTYGARARFTGAYDHGAYTASAGVRSDATAPSVVEFVKELKGYHDAGVTPEELAFTKSAIGQSNAREYETPVQKLGFLEEILTYDLPDGFVDEQNAILAALTKEEVDAIAKEWLDPAGMILVVVGDKATVSGPLGELGYPIVELDPNGEKVD
ncbi:MAG: insulinase family protein [Alphaproteobacteria bacterium]|nr:insulinase family protein [Alphaproteobacteria bacterium]